MKVDRLRCTPVLILLAFASALPAAETRISEGTNLAADVNPADGRVVFEMLDSLWLLPARGGEARRLGNPAEAAERPRWSPDGKEVLYQLRRDDGYVLQRLALDDDEPRTLTEAGQSEQMADWHPSGERIVYAMADRNGELDLWERDLATGLRWRLTRHAGNESDPAWSADGRHLAYVLQQGDHWYLVQKRFAQPPVMLAESDTPLHAPSWRPDNTLITYLASGDDDRLQLRMAILSAPPLLRTLADGEDFFLSPVSWLDRRQYLYTADGVIKLRGFDERIGSELPFSAVVGVPQRRTALNDRERPLPTFGDAPAAIVVRARRLFDGYSAGYRHDVDIVIEDGRIAAIEEQRDRGDSLVFDIGNVTAMPGLIDSYAGLPGDLTRQQGALLLAFGVTTLVSPDTPAGFDAADWLGDEFPGPRLLRALDAQSKPATARLANVGLVVASAPATGRRAEARIRDWREAGVPLMARGWQTGMATTADLVMAGDSLPLSPAGRRYQDLENLQQGETITLLSALATGATPGLDGLRAAPPAAWLPATTAVNRGRAGSHRPANGTTRTVVASRPSGLPPGLATQAELLALSAAGLSPARVLQAATGDAADALGLAPRLGRLAPGAFADLLLIAGDPLRQPADAVQVVAVVRGGRFVSVASLLDGFGQRDVE